MFFFPLFPTPSACIPPCALLVTTLSSHCPRAAHQNVANKKQRWPELLHAFPLQHLSGKILEAIEHTTPCEFLCLLSNAGRVSCSLTLSPVAVFRGPQRLHLEVPSVSSLFRNRTIAFLDPNSSLPEVGVVWLTSCYHLHRAFWTARLVCSLFISCWGRGWPLSLCAFPSSFRVRSSGCIFPPYVHAEWSNEREQVRLVSPFLPPNARVQDRSQTDGQGLAHRSGAVHRLHFLCPHHERHRVHPLPPPPILHLLRPLRRITAPCLVMTLLSRAFQHFDVVGLW